MLAVLVLAATTAWAGGPRFVTGTSGYAVAARNMVFRTSQPLYYTDPGSLSTGISHAQSDALVAAAANVWNVPTANLVLTQGGTLAEHVSSSNAYFDGTQVVFPADVGPANDLTIPIAVVYDTDGSITDLLLGQGASDPASCRQNGVTESVDAFGFQGTIDHAVIVLNGRCVGANAQQLLQMQYQLTRAFGRVLGLAWSQLNDNVFTGATTPTANEMAAWPLMHPMDVVCGPYTYQCMQNSFTLREDDLSTLALLYPVTAANALPGKTVSSAGAVGIEGWVTFPSQQGMEMVNVTVQRNYAGTSYTQPWQVASGVSGVRFAQAMANPVTGSATVNIGGPYDVWEGNFTMGRVLVGSYTANLTLTTEPINPLYTGAYAIGPYVRPPDSPAGSAASAVGQFEPAGTVQDFVIPVNDAPSVCSDGADGTEGAPSSVDPSGWQSDALCTLSHASWWNVTAKAARSWTLETTALDPSGAPTLQKAQPVIGVWRSADPTGTLPTVATSGVAMNSLALGVTQVPMVASTSAQTVRVAVADQFGAGRPDFLYQLRVLYADSISPAIVGLQGGQITITGTGFRQGNQVLLNGLKAKVLSWSATQIVAVAPAMQGAVAVDVEVLDATTNGSTVMQKALTYSTTVDSWRVVAASGAGQSVSQGTTLLPAAFEVVDAGGNAVAGAGVTVYQTVYAWEGGCPVEGRCASAPVLQTSQTAAVTDANGTVAVTPLVVAGVPQTVAIAVVAGTQGFASVTLAITPRP